MIPASAASGQDPPPHRLRTDRGHDCIGLGVQVEGGHRPERPGLGLEPGQVGCAMAQPDEVRGQDHCLPVDGPGEGLGGVHIAVRGAGARELPVGGFDAHHAQGNRGAARLEAGSTQQGGALGRRIQGDMDHGADVHPGPPQGKRRQHLVRVRLIGHPACHQFDHAGQVLRRYLEDADVAVDRTGALTRWRADPDRSHRRGRGHLGTGREPGGRRQGEQERVVPMGHLEPGKRRGGTATSGSTREDQAAHQRYEQAEQQP